MFYQTQQMLLLCQKTKESTIKLNKNPLINLEFVSSLFRAGLFMDANFSNEIKSFFTLIVFDSLEKCFVQTQKVARVR